MSFVKGCAVGAAVCGVIMTSANALALMSGPSSPAVTAPFHVLDAEGRTIMSVTEEEYGPMLTLAGRNGASARIGSNDTGMSVAVQSQPGEYVALTSRRGSAGVAIVSGDSSAVLSIEGDLRRLLIEKGEAELVSLGTQPGRNSALRIANPAGTVVAQMGSNPSNGGAGTVYVADNAGKNTGFMVSRPAGTAVLGIMANGTEAAMLQPSRDGSGGKITVANGSGTVVFEAGLATNGAGLACVHGNRTRCLNP